jgi:hypothetical protein
MRVMDTRQNVSHAALVIALSVPLMACQSPAPVSRPCGVIRDDLKTVQATTAGGNTRLAVHFERGKAAGCW